MAYYKNLRQQLKALEEEGLLVRVKTEINKDTELHPLVRLQFRGLPEEQRKAFLFENVVDSRGKKYSNPVTVCTIAGSTGIYALGMKCKPGEIAEKWETAQLHPIKPVMVNDAAVYEEVHVGDTLLEHGGLDEFPIPISTPGFDVAPYITSPYWVTKDPETGVRNIGTYRAQLKSPTRTGILMEYKEQHIAIHWDKCRKAGIPLQAAIVIGGSPNIGYVSVSKLPYGLDEFDIAGGIAGEPVELVKCRTVNLEVPANAEIIIEGELNTNEVEPEAPFGEFHGYMGLRGNMPYFTAKCIAHRKDAIWQSFISQLGPSESTIVTQIGFQAAIYNLLRHELNISSVKVVAIHARLLVVQMEKPERSEVMRALEMAAQHNPEVKICVAVDTDIDPWDIDTLNWAMASRAHFQRDAKIISCPGGSADYSIEPPDEILKRHADLEIAPQGARLLIDATLKWPYPPVSLPAREYMERAVQLWEHEGLPKLTLRKPWWGYNLGYWSKEYEEQAMLATKGKYYETGEVLAQRRKQVD
ncbi:UbiD family decarboxylase [Chloroflexota bacterium]